MEQQKTYSLPERGPPKRLHERQRVSKDFLQQKRLERFIYGDGRKTVGKDGRHEA